MLCSATRWATGAFAPLAIRGHRPRFTVKLAGEDQFAAAPLHVVQHRAVGGSWVWPEASASARRDRRSSAGPHASARRCAGGHRPLSRRGGWQSRHPRPTEKCTSGRMGRHVRSWMSSGRSRRVARKRADTVASRGVRPAYSAPAPHPEVTSQALARRHLFGQSVALGRAALVVIGPVAGGAASPNAARHWCWHLGSTNGSADSGGAKSRPPVYR